MARVLFLALVAFTPTSCSRSEPPVVETEPTDATRARNLQEEGRVEEALQLYLTLDPATHHRDVVVCYMDLERPAPAARYLEQYVDDAEDKGDLYSDAGALYEQAGEFTAAARVHQKQAHIETESQARRDGSADPAEHLQEAARLFERAGETEAARSCLREMIQVHQQDEEISKALAVADELGEGKELRRSLYARARELQKAGGVGLPSVIYWTLREDGYIPEIMGNHLVETGHKLAAEAPFIESVVGKSRVGDAGYVDSRLTIRFENSTGKICDVRVRVFAGGTAPPRGQLHRQGIKHTWDIDLTVMAGESQHEVVVDMGQEYASFWVEIWSCRWKSGTGH